VGGVDIGRVWFHPVALDLIKGRDNQQCGWWVETEKEIVDWIPIHFQRITFKKTLGRECGWKEYIVN